MTDKVVIYKGPGAISFHGRAQRREWLIGVAVNIFIGSLIGSLSSIGPILSLPWIIVVLAVTSRRLHDLGRSGWFQLIPMAVFALFIALCAILEPAALKDGNFQFDLGGPGHGIVTAGFLTVLAVYLAFYVWLAGVPGTPGPNCYGEVD